jgi:hypothetical protein
MVPPPFKYGRLCFGIRILTPWKTKAFTLKSRVLHLRNMSLSALKYGPFPFGIAAFLPWHRGPSAMEMGPSAEEYASFCYYGIGAILPWNMGLFFHAKWPLLRGIWRFPPLEIDISNDLSSAYEFFNIFIFSCIMNIINVRLISPQL